MKAQLRSKQLKFNHRPRRLWFRCLSTLAERTFRHLRLWNSG